MRGTGYAIGEILIFLAIAAIIGFLIGWLVFYRKPGKVDGLSPANPNHVRRLEERAKTVDSKMARVEKRANLLLESLSRASRPTAAATTAGAAAGEAEGTRQPDAKIAPASAGPAKGETPTDQDKPAPPETKDKPPTPSKEKEKAAADPQAKPAATPTDQDKPAPPETKDKPPTPSEEKEKAAADDVDSYLSEADERIHRLEETLDALSDKLAELED